MTRILSFDGAAAAALQIRLVEFYEKETPGFLAKTDVFAGSSDGALMALYLAQYCTDDHEQNLRVIQRAIELSNRLVPLFGLRIWKLLKFATGWFPLLDGDDWKQTLAEAYGEMRLGQVEKKVLAVAFNVQRWTPQIFSNLPVPGDTLHVPDLPRPNPIPPHPDPEKAFEEANGAASFDADTMFSFAGGQASVLDAALASSAAPLALPLRRVGKREPSVDGGTAATNPTLLAITRTCEWQAGGPDAERVRAKLPTVRVLSLGATESAKGRQRIINGFVPDCLSFRCLNWGYMQWLVLRPLLLGQMLYQGQIDTVDYQCSRLLTPAQYHRIRPQMAQVQGLLDLLFLPPRCTIAALDEEAQQLVQSTAFQERNLPWLENSWMKDVEASGAGSDR